MRTSIREHRTGLRSLSRGSALGLLLALSGCSYLFPPEPPEKRAPDPVRFIPPGSRDEDVAESFETLVARAEEASQAKRPVQALRWYREALKVVTPATPAATLEQVKARVQELSLDVGVPATIDRETETSSPNALTPEQTARISEARALDSQARQAESLLKTTEALALYRKVVATLRESDDSTLYWRAWQKVEDLSPEGEGPAAMQERLDQVSARSEAQEEKLEQADDGTLVSAGTRAGGRPADVALSEARATYMKGMSWVRAGEPILARTEFERVLGLIRESQDPELYRAARQNLADLARAASLKGRVPGEGGTLPAEGRVVELPDGAIGVEPPE